MQPNFQTVLRRVLLKLGMTYSDLSVRSGLKIGTLYNLGSGGNRSLQTRRRVEAVLGVRIWSNQSATVQLRCSAAAQASQPGCGAIPSAAKTPDASSN
jgi:predicted transcriptional regulator